MEQFNNNNLLLNKTEFTYEFLGTGNLSKRMLKSVKSLDTKGNINVTSVFEYHGSDDTSLLGKIKAFKNGNGGRVNYTYSNVSLSTSNSSLNTKINAPLGYSDPKVYVGADYTLVFWRQKDSGGNIANAPRNVKAYVYTWKGYWKEQFLRNFSDVKMKDGVWERFEVALGINFFAINVFHSFSTKTLNWQHKTYLYNRNITDDSWSKTEFVDDTGRETEGSKKNDYPYKYETRPSLYAGERFVALVPFVRNEIITYILRENKWVKKEFKRFNHLNVADDAGFFHTSVGHNYIIDHNKKGTDKLSLYYLDELDNWQKRAISSTFQSNELKRSYLYPSKSFITIMARDNPEYIYTWDQNFNRFKKHSPYGEYADHSLVLNYANTSSTIADMRPGIAVYDWIIQSKTSRYDGSNFVTTPKITGISEKGITVSEDYFIRDSGNSGNQQASVSIFDANSLQLIIDKYNYTHNNGELIFSEGYNPLQTGGDHALIFNKFYNINNKREFGYAGTLRTPSSERINITSVSAGKDFYIYQLSNSSNSITDKYRIQFIKNGRLASNMIGSGYFYGLNSLKSETFPNIWNKNVKSVGFNIYVTYGVSNPSETSESVELFRVRNQQSVGYQEFSIVNRVSIDSGLETTYTSFDYDRTTAMADPSGLSPRFHKVTVVLGSSSATHKPFGYIVNHFYNKASVKALGQRLIGQNYDIQSYDKNAQLISKNTTTSTSYSKLAGTYKLYYIRVTEQIAENYGVATSQENSYSEETGLITETKTENYNSKGEWEQIKTNYKYWWEAYDTDRSRHIFNKVIQTKRKVGNVYTHASATTFDGTNHDYPYQSLSWKGIGSPDFMNFTSAANTYNNWLITSSVTKRDSEGNVLETKTPDGIYNAAVFDKKLKPVGSFSNTRERDVFYDNFDDNLLSAAINYSYHFSCTHNTGFQNSMGELKYSGTAEGMVHNESAVPSDVIFEFKAKRSTNRNGWIGLIFRKKSRISRGNISSSNGISFRILKNAIAVYNQNEQLAYVNWPNNNSWDTYRLLIKAGKLNVYINTKLYIAIDLPPADGRDWCFYGKDMIGSFDDFRAYPDDAIANTSSHDAYYNNIKAVGPSGTTSNKLYDKLYPVATIDPLGYVAGTNAHTIPFSEGLEMSGDNLNLIHQSSSLGDFSAYEDFSILKYNWTKKYHSGNLYSDWILADGKLNNLHKYGTHRSPDYFYTELPESLTGVVAMEFSVLFEEFPSSWDFGFAAGGNQWSVRNGGNECALWIGLFKNSLKGYGNGSWNDFKNNLKKDRWYRLKFVINTLTNKIDYYADGKLLLSGLSFRSSSDDINKIAFFNYNYSSNETANQIDNLVIYTEPAGSTSYSDGSGKPIQQVSEIERGQVMVSESVYDPMGRPYVQAMGTSMDGNLNFHKDFIKQIDQAGRLSGKVEELNNLGDYPYSKYKFQDFPSGGVTEASAPGYNFRIGSGNNTIQNTYNNEQSPIKMGVEFPLKQYYVQETISPDGGRSYLFTDRSGQLIMQKEGTIKGQEERPVYKNKIIEGKAFENATYEFTAIRNHTVSFDYDDKKSRQHKMKIGTSPNTSNIKIAYSDRSGSFEAEKDETYYITIEFQPIPPPAVYYDYYCTTVIPFNPDYCFNGNKCRVQCIDLPEPCDKSQVLINGGPVPIQPCLDPGGPIDNPDEPNNPYPNPNPNPNPDPNPGGPTPLPGGPTLDPSRLSLPQLKESYYILQDSTVAENQTDNNLPAPLLYVPDVQRSMLVDDEDLPVQGFRSSDELSSMDFSNAESADNKLKTILPALSLHYIKYFEWEEQEIYATTSSEYDVKGNLVKTYPPNYHNPPVGEEEQRENFILTNSYNSLNRLKTTHSPDRGTSRFVYETETGRLRYWQDQNAIDSGQVLYVKYDSYGREIETGYFDESWDEGKLQTKADMDGGYPYYPKTWRIKTTYAEHGENTINYSAVSMIETNNNANYAVEIRELFIYNELGQLISRTLENVPESKSHSFLYEYNKLGELISEDYGEGPGKVTYHYDLSGRLKSIGNEDNPVKYVQYQYDVNGALSSEVFNSGAYTRSYTYDNDKRLIRLSDPHFREDIAFSGGYNNAAYSNGLIARTTYDYKGISTLQGKADTYYNAYQYDNLGQLVYNDNSIDNTLDIDVGYNEIGYDPNGNTRQWKKGTTLLENAYNPGTNRLKGVNTSDTQYEYDGNGNVLYAKEMGLVFNYDPFFNKSYRIEEAVTAVNTSFYFSSDGERVYKAHNSESLQSQTYYYRSTGAYPAIEKYQDNLGNDYSRYYIHGLNGIAAIMESTQTVVSATATLEEANLAHEEKLFEISQQDGSRVNAKLFNHTDSTGASYSLRLSGMAGEEKGLSYVVPVNKGDTIKTEVFAKYLDLKNDPKVNAMLLAMGIGGAAIGNTAGLEGLSQTKTAANSGAGLLAEGSSNEAGLKAFLNYILLDSLGNMLDAGYMPVTSEALEDGSNVAHEKLAIERVAVADGYLYTFVSNESASPQEVFFDDLTLSVTAADQLYFIAKDHLGSTRVLVRDDNTVKASYDYDVYGNVVRYEGSEEVNYQFTGQEFDKEIGLHNYRARFYDANLGRFLAVDPMAAKYPGWSPYAAMANNPISFIDPNGEEPITLAIAAIAIAKAAAISAGVSAASYTLNYTATDQWGSGNYLNGLGNAAARGAISGALTGGLALGGTAIATSLAAQEVTFTDGLLNIGYQALSTAGADIGTNLILDDAAFSHVDIGIGDFNVPIRGGKFSANPIDHIGNVASAISYGKGFYDVAKGRSTVKLDKLTLAPVFTETKASRYGYAWIDEELEVTGGQGERYKGVTTNMLDRASSPSERVLGLNQRGAIFLRNGVKNRKQLLFHESLHSIHDRIAGEINPFIDFHIFGSKNWHHDSRYFEIIVNYFESLRYP